VDSKRCSTPIGYLHNGATIIAVMNAAPSKQYCNALNAAPALWTPRQVTQALMAVATTG
jgi:hypothetical protein